MRTIWKFPLPLSDEFTLTAPRDAIPRRVENGYLWAEVNTDNPSQTYRFATVGTGHPAPPHGIYRGTWFQGQFVWHLYELPFTG